MRALAPLAGGDAPREAPRRENYPVTLECIQAKPLGRLEAIFGHGRDRPTATAIVNRADAAGFTGVKLRNDPCGGVEGGLAALRGASAAPAAVTPGEDPRSPLLLRRTDVS